MIDWLVDADGPGWQAVMGPPRPVLTAAWRGGVEKGLAEDVVEAGVPVRAEFYDSLGRICGIIQRCNIKERRL